MAPGLRYGRSPALRGSQGIFFAPRVRGLVRAPPQKNSKIRAYFKTIKSFERVRVTGPGSNPRFSFTLCIEQHNRKDDNLPVALSIAETNSVVHRHHGGTPAIKGVAKRRAICPDLNARPIGSRVATPPCGDDFGHLPRCLPAGAVFCVQAPLRGRVRFVEPGAGDEINSPVSARGIRGIQGSQGVERIKETQGQHSCNCLFFYLFVFSPESREQPKNNPPATRPETHAE